MSELIGPRPDGIAFFEPGEEILPGESFRSREILLGDLGVGVLSGIRVVQSPEYVTADYIEQYNKKQRIGFLPGPLLTEQLNLLNAFDPANSYLLTLTLDGVPSGLDLICLATLPHNSSKELWFTSEAEIDNNQRTFKEWNMFNTFNPIYFLSHPDSTFLNGFRFTFKVKMNALKPVSE